MAKRGLAALVVAVGFMAGCMGNAEQGLDTADQARDLAAQTDLQNAAVVAGNVYATSGGYQGFTAAEGKSLEPSIKWADGGDPTIGVVSIRGADATSLVLVTKAESGTILCIGLTPGGQSQGTTDAETAPDCSGGW